jgi:glycosyltransferase involved in cell wall biosynthesis/tetratricopeptide (TPR) repeat protein
MPTLSLCLIARDEAAMIGDCLASVAGVVDQIVVVDTGSADETPRLARDAGAKVIDHPWQGDFAAARNAALAEATGDWILVLDADERLAPGAGAAIRAAIQTGGFDLGFLPLHNASSLDADPQAVRSGAARLGEAVLLPRLIRRTPDLRWEGIIHESVDAWFSQGRRAVSVEADLIHLGNVPEIKSARNKTSRNLTLLQRAVVLKPADPMAAAWLARERLRTGDRVQAEAEAAQAWRLTVAAVARGEKPSLVLPATLLSFLMLERGAPASALAVINEALELGGDHPNLDLLLATALQCTGQLELAEAAARCCLARQGGLFTSEVMPGACSWAAAGILGEVLLRRGDTEGAIRWLTAALRDNPAHTHARLALAEAWLERDEPQQSLKVIEPALTESPEAWTIAAAASLRHGDVATAEQLLERGQPGGRAALHARVSVLLTAHQRIQEISGQPPAPGPDATALIEAGEASFSAGDINGALENILAGLLQEPGLAVGWQDLGAVLHAVGELAAAEQAIRLCLELDPEADSAWESLGHLLAEAGHRAEAADVFRQLAARAPEVAQEALRALGVEQEAPASTEAPLISVLIDATGADPAPALDRLALQDLHPALFEVIVVGVQAVRPRPFAVGVIPGPEGVPLEAGRAAARGRWILLLQAEDRPQPDLLRRHLAALARSATPTAVLGVRQAQGSAATAAPPPEVFGPPSNISLPRALRVGLDIGDGALVGRLDAAGIRVIRSDVTVHHAIPDALCELETLWESRGAALRAAWLADPALPLPALPGDPGREESWLGLRMVTEAMDTSRAHGRLRTALNHGLLGVPRSPRPALETALTSIIIPNLNGFPHIEGCVSSLRRHTTGPVELIVVDNGSTDGSLEWLSRQPDIQLVDLGENLGAPAARNHGLQLARGETIVFCDNDVVFTPRWRPLLLSHLGRWPDIGMVGPMSDYVVGAQKIDPMPPPGTDLDSYAAAITAQRAGQHIYTSRLILFFLIGRRELFDQIGGICESYGRWGFEDDDLSIRAAAAGWRLRIAGDCFIRHIGSQTSKTANIDYDALLLKNWEVFKRRWGLPMEQPYGPYDPAAILSRPYAHSELYVPFDKGRIASEPLRLVSMR